MASVNALSSTSQVSNSPWGYDLYIANGDNPNAVRIRFNSQQEYDDFQTYVNGKNLSSGNSMTDIQYSDVMDIVGLPKQGANGLVYSVDSVALRKENEYLSPAANVVEIKNGDSSSVKVKFASVKEAQEFKKQAGQLTEKKFESVEFFEVMGYLSPQTGGVLYYSYSPKALDNLKSTGFFFGGDAVQNLEAGRSLELTTSAKGNAQYLHKMPDGTVLASKSNFNKVMGLVAASTGKYQEDLTVDDIRSVISEYASSEVFVENPAVNTAGVQVLQFSKQALGAIQNLLPLKRPENLDKAVVVDIKNAYSQNSAVLSDSAKAARIAYLWQVGIDFYRENQKNQGFTAFVDDAKLGKDVAEFSKAFFKQSNVEKGQVAILQQLGLVEMDASGQYDFTNAGIEANAEFKAFYIPNSQPSKVASHSSFVPSITLGMLTPEVLLDLQLVSGDPASLSTLLDKIYKGKDEYKNITTKFVLLKNVPSEQFDLPKDSGAAQVLEKIFGKDNSYNKTQINLGIASGFLKFDANGKISVTDQGKELLKTSNKPTENPIEKSLAAQYLHHLEVVERDRDFFAFDDPKHVFTWKKFNDIAIANGKGPSGKLPTEEQIAAANFLADNWDNPDKPILVPLRTGAKGDLDNKVGIRDIVNVRVGLEAVLQDASNRAGLPYKNFPTGAVPSKTLPELLNHIGSDDVFRVHQRHRSEGSDQREHTGRQPFLLFTDEFVGSLLASDKPEYVKLGQDMQMLRDNYHGVWMMLKAGDEKVSKAGIKQAIAMLSTPDFTGKKPDPNAKPTVGAAAPAA